MAFLDNSGDIILDAVLTDVGRKRMAAGNFKITKFAFGDDEIDYGLYNKTHPSGSAYYDLQILQTPVLEAFTQANANINYGLLTYARTDLLYLPTIKQNITGIGVAALGTPLYLADNSAGSTLGTLTSTALADDSIVATQILISGDPSTLFILFETGLDTADLSPTSENQSTYITKMGLLDSNFTISYDNRLIGTINYANSAVFRTSATGTTCAVSAWASGTGAVRSRDLAGYNTETILAHVSAVFSDVTGVTAAIANAASALAGPKGAYQMIVPKILSPIPDTLFASLGKVNQSLGGSNLYNYIDTSIYIVGQATNVTLQIPLRIIKLVSV